MEERVYLDHAATTPLDPGALRAMLPFLADAYGNPSSLHAFGRAALDAVDDARREVAELIGGEAREVLFTGGGTEADNLALRGALQAVRGQGRTAIVVSAVEHEAVLETARALSVEAGAELRVARVDASGRVDLEDLGRLTDERTALVSVMRAQNETGVLEDVGAAAAIAHRVGALCHSDAVAAVMASEVDVAALGVDLLSVSAHKMYGPKGVGALWVREGVAIAAASTGGGQERGRRAGTHNVPGIVGFGAAAALTRRDGPAWRVRMRRLKERLWERLREVPDVVRSGEGADTTAATLHVRARGAAADSVLIGLDAEGVAVSAGSACSAGVVGPSHVLVAMGLDRHEAATGIRFSLGRATSEDEIERAAAVYVRVIRRVRGARSRAASA